MWMKKASQSGIAVLMAAVMPVLAGTVVYDDFSDQSVDLSKWTYSAVSAQEIITSGTAADQWGAGEWDYPAGVKRIKITDGWLRSLASAQLVEDGMVTFSGDIQIERWKWGSTFGLANSRGDSIRIAVDNLGQGNGVYVTMSVGGVSQHRITSVPANVVRNYWTIQWSKNRVVIISDNQGVVFDSAVTTTDANGNPWNIPAVGTALQIHMNTGYVSNSWVTANYLKLEADASPFRLLVADDFFGSTINSAKWVTNGNVAPYTATETANGGTWNRDVDYDWKKGERRVLCRKTGGVNAWMKSKNAFTLFPGTKLVLHGVEAKMQRWAGGSGLGFQSPDANNYIIFGLRLDGNAGVQIAMRANGGTAQKFVISDFDEQLVTGGWRVVWADGYVQVISDLWGLKFDSRVNPPAGSSNPADWVIPAPGRSMQAYLSAGWNNDYWVCSNAISVFQMPLAGPVYIDETFDSDPYTGDAYNGMFWLNRTEFLYYPTAYAKYAYGQLHLQTTVDGSKGKRAGLSANHMFYTQPTASDPVVFVLENVQDYRIFFGAEANKEFFALMDNWDDYASWAMKGINFGITSQVLDGSGSLKFRLQNQPANFFDYKEIWIDPVWGAQWRTDGTWMIVWETTRITVYHNGELLFNTDTDSGKYGTQPGQWAIPNAPLAASVMCYWPNAQAEWTMDRLYCGPRSKLFKGAYGKLKRDLNASDKVDSGDLLDVAASWLASTNPSVAGPNVVDATDSLFINVPQTTIAPTLDGIKSAGEWNDAVVVPFNGLVPNVAPGIVGGAKSIAPMAAYSLDDLSATAYLKYDANYLYVGVEVLDDNVIVNYPDTSVWLGDSVELYFDLDNSRSKGFADEDPAQPDKCTKGLQLIAGCVADPDGYPDDNQTFPADPTNTYQPETWWRAIGGYITGGYFVEFRISLAGTGMQPGKGYGFDIGVNDIEPQNKRKGFLAYKGANNKDEAPFAMLVLTPKTGCGSYGFMPADLNRDCTVNLKDLAILAADWLYCVDVNAAACPNVLSCFANPEKCY